MCVYHEFLKEAAREKLNKPGRYFQIWNLYNCSQGHDPVFSAESCYLQMVLVAFWDFHHHSYRKGPSTFVMFNNGICLFKGTVMQIWKFPYMFVFIWKQYLENFAFLILRTIKLFARENCKFLKKCTNSYFILLFWNVYKQIFHISHVHISQNVKGALLRRFQHIIFMWRWKYWQISKSALVHLQVALLHPVFNRKYQVE